MIAAVMRAMIPARGNDETPAAEGEEAAAQMLRVHREWNKDGGANE